MANGLKINVSEAEFKAKDPAERDWMLFQAASKIDQFGCSFGRASHQKNWLKGIAVGAGAFGAAFGIAVELASKCLR